MPPREIIESRRLRLVPIAVDDAPVLADIFDEPAILRYIGGPVPREVLQDRFERMREGSMSEDEDWLTWTVRYGDDTVGIVQATIHSGGAQLAWVVGLPWQRRGFGSEAALALQAWLMDFGFEDFIARIHPDNAASHVVARRLGLLDTGQLDANGESIWIRGNPRLPESAEPSAG